MPDRRTTPLLRLSSASSAAALLVTSPIRPSFIAAQRSLRVTTACGSTGNHPSCVDVVNNTTAEPGPETLVSARGRAEVHAHAVV